MAGLFVHCVKRQCFECLDLEHPCLLVEQAALRCGNQAGWWFLACRITAAVLEKSHVSFIFNVYFSCKVVVLAAEVDDSDEENWTLF